VASALLHERGVRLTWRATVAVLAALCLALVVAAMIKRDPPDFANLPVIAVVRDDAERPLWEVRLARAAHAIAADSLRPQTPPAGYVYRLWLTAPDGEAPHQLGLLPASGRKQIPVIPEVAGLLAGAGELIVTLEPLGGSPLFSPNGPTIFRATLDRAG
jgi:anti-sigma-K factor RskA